LARSGESRGPSGRCVGVQPDDSLRRRLVDGSGGRSLDLGKREGHAPPPSAGVDSSGRMDAHRRDGPVAMRRRRRLSSGAGTGSSLGPRARSPSIRPPFPRSRGPRLKAPGLPGCVAAPRARTALYEPAEHRGLALQFAQDINVRAFCYFSLALWHRGYPDQASKAAGAAVQYAKESAHAHTLAYAQGFSAMTATFDGCSHRAPCTETPSDRRFSQT